MSPRAGSGDDRRQVAILALYAVVLVTLASLRLRRSFVTP